MNDVGMGALLEGDWESLCNLFASEAPDFGAQFLDHHPSNNPSLVTASIDYNECFYYDPNNSLSDTTSYNNLLLQFSDSYQNCQFSMPNDVYLRMNNGVMDQTNHSPLASDLSANVNVHQGYNSPRLGSVEDNESDNLGSPHSPVVQVKRKYSAPDVQAEPKAKSAPKKKARVSINRGKKNIVESVKHAPENGADPGVEESSDSESKACRETSEEEIPASKELLVVSETSKGKKRASRGTATDPQSLYARKRRERINERLRILQNLVPNGTKVDISTMLEEAVHYVKFLQLQIQLLSSDELWMYAPIAYNGVDINLYKRISPFQLP